MLSSVRPTAGDRKKEADYLTGDRKRGFYYLTGDRKQGAYYLTGDRKQGDFLTALVRAGKQRGTDLGFSDEFTVNRMPHS